MKTFLGCADYSQFIDYVKYSTTYMHAKSLKQTVLPTPPKWYQDGAPLIFTGAVRRWLRNRIMSGFNNVNQHLFWSIANVKRCAQVVPEDFIWGALKKHRTAMAKPAVQPSNAFIESFEHKVDNVLRMMKYRKANKVFEYSTNACYERTLLGGGAKTHLLYDHVREGLTSNDELLSMDYCPHYGVTERRGFVTQSLATLLDLPSIIDPVTGTVKRCVAKVYPICEPLKIRTITASNAYPYAIAKGMQMDMHSYFKQFRQFQLIGKPLVTEDISILNKSRKAGELIASGDFSAATDNISIVLTKICFEKILKMFCDTNNITSKRQIDVLRSVLYEHEIEYPTQEQLFDCIVELDEDGRTPDVLDNVVMQNGQLMGSVLSFPILCLINLVTYWIAVEPETRDFMDLRVMINGDDILFCATPDAYQKWLDTLPQAGLIPSPGKNFFCDSYCTVNSALFSCKQVLEGDRVVQREAQYIPFFNVGMLLGQSKVARQEEGREKPIFCLHQRAMHGALNEAQADSRFRYYNNFKLAECSNIQTHKMGAVQLNYYLPRAMGGLGMKLPQGKRFVRINEYHKMLKNHDTDLSNVVLVTDVQLRLAEHLIKAWREPYERPPIEPIGFQKDLDAEDKNFSDIKKRTLYISIPENCPRLESCIDVPSELHPPNWSAPATDSYELERLKFTFKGLAKHLKWVRGKKIMIDVDNEYLHSELRTYKWNGIQTLSDVPPPCKLTRQIGCFSPVDGGCHSGV